MRKLYLNGFRGKAYELMKSYLSGKRHLVEFDGIRSSAKIVKYGVPQGTVLGPILFLIYINGLLRMRKKGDIFFFLQKTL